MNAVFTPVFPLSTLIISCLEMFFLFFAIIQSIAINNKSNLHFTVLILMFLQYNMINSFLPNYNYDVHVLIQNILAYVSGIVLASYYFYYLYIELDFEFVDFFGVKFLLISLFTTFLIAYVGTYLYTGSTTLARQIFIGFPCLIAFYFCYHTVKSLLHHQYRTSKITHFKVLVFTGSIGIIFMATMPVVVVFGDNHKGWNHLLVNVSLLLASFAYIKRYFYISRKQLSNTQNKNNIFHLSDLKKQLTNREFELSYMLVQKELSYKEIGKMMYISSGTVSKHASNIYHKTQVEGRAGFIEKYLPD